MKVCPKCGAKNSKDARFCVSCGEDLDLEIKQTEEIKSCDLTEVVSPENLTQKVEEILGGEKSSAHEIFIKSGICPNCLNPFEGKRDVCPECGFVFYKKKEVGKGRKRYVLYYVIGGVFILSLAFFLLFHFFVPQNVKNIVKKTSQGGEKIEKKTEVNELIKNAELYENLKDYDQAILSWKKVIKSNPGNLDALKHLCVLYFKKKDFSNALKYADQVIKKTNKFPEIFYIRGVIEKNKRQFDDAINDFRTALSLSPENEKYIFSLGELYMDVGKYEEAYNIFKRLEGISKKDKKDVLKKLIKCADLLGKKKDVEKYTLLYRREFPEDVESVNFKDAEEKKMGKDTASGETRERVNEENSSSLAKSEERRENPKTSEKVNASFSVSINSQGVVIPGKRCSVEIMLGGKSFQASCTDSLIIDGLTPGTLSYEITVRYFSLSTGELEESFSGSGFVEIRYNNQNLYVKILGKKVILE